MARLEAMIAHAENNERQLRAGLAELVEGDAAPLRALLSLTEDHLACLRESRTIGAWEAPAG